MHQNISKRFLVYCLASMVFSWLPLSGYAQSHPTFPISSVIEQVKREIAAAQSTTGANLNLILEKVEVTLSVSRSVDANGKVTIGVPVLTGDATAGGSRKVEESSSIYVELVPPKPSGVLASTVAKDFGLTDAIIETRRELLKGLSDEPKLDPRKVVITVKFTVTRNVNAGGQLKLAVVSVGAGGSIGLADTNTIILSFTKSKAP